MRQQNRITIRSLFRIKVNTRHNDQLIGYVGDISEHGVRLVCDAPMEVGSVLELRLRMRGKDGAMRYAEIDGKCLWARENTQTGYFEAGLILEKPSMDFSELVREMRGSRASRGEAEAPAAD